jgi:hypothetical protein
MRVPHTRKLGEPACIANFLLTRVTRIFQKRILTKFAPAHERRRASVPNATSRRRKRPLGAVLLFPDCCLQWLAQLTRVTSAIAAQRAAAMQVELRAIDAGAKLELVTSG